MCKYHNGIFLIALLIIGLANSGCKKERIPERDMAQVFAEIFITDATIESSKLSLRYTKKDTIEYYKPIYSSMGYTEEQFNNTIQFYADNPEVLDKVLDKAINILSRIETEHLAQMTREAKEEEAQGLWEGKRNWRLPEDGKQETIEFKIPLHGSGEYTISAEVRILFKDKSINPRMVAWFHADSLNAKQDTADIQPGDTLNNKLEKADTLKTDTLQKQWVDYQTDGINRAYNLTLTLTDTTYTHIKGEIMSHSEQENDDWDKSAVINNISVYYTPPKKPWYKRGIKPAEKLVKDDSSSKKERLKPRKRIEEMDGSGIKRR